MFLYNNLQSLAHCFPDPASRSSCLRSSAFIYDQCPVPAVASSAATGLHLTKEHFYAPTLADGRHH